MDCGPIPDISTKYPVNRRVSGKTGLRDLAKVALRDFRRKLREEQGKLGEQRLQPMKKPASGGRFGEIPDLAFKSESEWRCRQTNANSSLLSADEPLSGGQKLSPFLKRGVSFRFEYRAAVEVAIKIKMVVERGVGRGEFLQVRHSSESRHGPLSSPER